MPATTAFDKNEARALLLPEDDAFAAAAFSPSQPPPLRSPQSAPSFANDWFSGAAGSPPLSTGSPDLPDAFNSLLSIGEMGAAAAAAEDAAAAPRPSGGAIPQLAAAAAARAAAAIAQNNYSQAASLLLGAVKANAAAAASPYARSAHASPTNDDAARVKLTEERLIAALLSSQPYDLAGADLHMDPVLQLARAAAVAAEDMHVIAGAAPGQASTRRQQQHQQAPPPSHSSQTSGRDSSQQQQGPLQRHKLYKTELCRSFEEMGYCRYGAKCQFAHGPEELRAVVRHPKYKTEVCRTFSINGTCPYGTRCRFIHTRGKDAEANNSESPEQDQFSLRAAATTTVATSCLPCVPSEAAVAPPPPAAAGGGGRMRARSADTTLVSPLSAAIASGSLPMPPRRGASSHDIAAVPPVPPSADLSYSPVSSSAWRGGSIMPSPAPAFALGTSWSSTESLSAGVQRKETWPPKPSVSGSPPPRPPVRMQRQTDAFFAAAAAAESSSNSDAPLPPRRLRVFQHLKSDDESPVATA